MATFASLVVSLTARAEGMIAGLKQADGAVAKFQNSLGGKLLRAGAIVGALDKAFDALGNAARKAADGEMAFGAALQETLTTALTSLPVIGGLNKLAIALRDEWLGDAEALRGLNAELAEHKEKLDSLNRTLSVTRDAYAIAAEAARMLAESQNPGDAALKLQNDIDRINAKYAELIRKLGEATQSQEEYRRALRALKQARVDEIETAEQLARNVEAEIKAREAATAAAEAQAKAGQRAGVLQGLEEQIILLRDGAAALEQYRFAQMGATEADLARMRALQAEIAVLQHQEELQRRAQQVIESIMTPMERYTEELRKLQELLEANLLTQEQYARAVALARAELERYSVAKEKADELRTPGAREQRFTAGFPAQGQASKQPLFELKDNSKNVLVQAKQQTAIQKRMLRAFEDARDDTEVVNF